MVARSHRSMPAAERTVSTLLVVVRRFPALLVLVRGLLGRRHRLARGRLHRGLAAAGGRSRRLALGRYPPAPGRRVRDVVLRRRVMLRRGRVDATAAAAAATPPRRPAAWAARDTW